MCVPDEEGIHSKSAAIGKWSEGFLRFGRDPWRAITSLGGMDFNATGFNLLVESNMNPDQTRTLPWRANAIRMYKELANVYHHYLSISD